jgi:hypothetical protein
MSGLCGVGTSLEYRFGLFKKEKFWMAEQYEEQRRDAINKMKCLKRAEKSEALAAQRLANEKMELEVLTSAMLFTEVCPPISTDYICLRLKT